MQALFEHRDADVRVVRQAGPVDPQLLGVAPVGEDVRRQHAAAVVVDRRQHRGARAVAEQDRGVAAAGRLVEPARVHLGANQQDAFVLPGANPGVGN